MCLPNNSQICTKHLGTLQDKTCKATFHRRLCKFPQCNKSVSDFAYLCLPYGPVPDKYQTLLGLLEECGIIESMPREYDDWSGEIVAPGERTKRIREKGIQSEPLPPNEIDILEKVIKRYGNLTSNALTELSHKGQVWKSRCKDETIPYEEAGSVKLVRQLWK